MNEENEAACGTKPSRLLPRRYADVTWATWIDRHPAAFALAVAGCMTIGALIVRWIAG